MILLDLALPDSQGLETFFAMHAHAGDVPIVVLSGYDDEATAIKAVQAGAQDYLVKGQVNDNLLVRSIRYAIERSRRHRAEEALRDTSEEFRAAQEIQQRLYPAEAAGDCPASTSPARSIPAKATAGDYFDYIPMLDGCLGIVVGDVSSHGMGPALLMSETRACLRTLAQAYCDVGEILTRANRLLTADTDDFHFVTLAMARLDPRTASWSTPAPASGATCSTPAVEVTVLDSTSLPLGVDGETPSCPPPRRSRSRPGDIVHLLHRRRGRGRVARPRAVRRGPGVADDSVASESGLPARSFSRCTTKCWVSAATSPPAMMSPSLW